MTRTSLLLLLSGLTVACSPVNAVTEICANKIDDDNNGQVDCDDVACSGKEGCPVKDTDAGYYGTCVKCGRLCTAQSACLSDAGYFYNEQPLPFCEGGKCTSYRAKTSVNLRLTGDLFAGTLVARLIEKKAVDGSAVTCARVATARGAMSSALENAGFNLAAWLYRPVGMTEPSVSMQLNTTNATTDYLVDVELWGGAPDSTTRYPPGQLLSRGCVETGLMALAENAACDGGVTCYPTINLTLRVP